MAERNEQFLNHRAMVAATALRALRLSQDRSGGITRFAAVFRHAKRFTWRLPPVDDIP